MTDPLSRVFAALADPTRRDMVARLTAGDATVGELAAPYRVRVQAVSKHLKVLEDAGLVSRGRRQPSAPGPPGGGGARPHDRVDRAIPPRGGAALPTAGRRAGRHETEETRRNHHDLTEAAIEADPKLPIIRMTRDFTATPQQLLRAHTDPDLFARWVGPTRAAPASTTGTPAPAAAGGYVHATDGEEYGFRGTFHEMRPDRIVQTFTLEGSPTASRWRR